VGTRTPDLYRVKIGVFGFTTTYKSAGTAEVRGSRARHRMLWVGSWVDALREAVALGACANPSKLLIHTAPVGRMFHSSDFAGICPFLDSFRLADNPPGTRTNGSSMSALVCIANGSVPITHRTSADSDACPPTCYRVFGIGASRKSSTNGPASGHDTDHSSPRGRPRREVSFRRRRSLSFIILFKFAAGRISISPHFNLEGEMSRDTCATDRRSEKILMRGPGAVPEKSFRAKRLHDVDAGGAGRREHRSDYRGA
jgi:hypothetical protein